MQKVVELMNRDELSSDERLGLLDELYWIEWNKLSNEYPETVNKIFMFLRNTEFNEEEISFIQKLYNNPEGAYIEEFSYIIAKLYREDKAKFFKALHLNPDEGDNLAYLFRNKRIFADGNAELDEILHTNKLTKEEADTTEIFFRMYENLCNT